MSSRTAQHPTGGPSHRRPRAALAVVVVVSVFLGLAAPSLADPSRPGLTEATQAVYPHPGQGVEGVLVQSPEAGGDKGGDKGGGRAGAPAGAPAGAQAQHVASDESGLPFTGLSAALVLLAGLIALTLGLTLRIATRPSLTGSSSRP
jgi:hypothetical protein